MARQLNARTINEAKIGEGLPNKRQAPSPYHAYKDVVGVWTIGYGHTAGAGAPVPVAGMKLSGEAEATELLRKDLAKYAAAVEKAVKVPLTDNEFGAVVLWTYNIGIGGMEKSTAIKLLNKGDRAGFLRSHASWNKGTVKGKKVLLKGLVNRRAQEAALFTAGQKIAAADPEGAEVHTTKSIGFGILAKPEILTPAAGVGTAMFAAAASPGPLQIAVAAVVVVMAVVAAFYAIKRIRES